MNSDLLISNLTNPTLLFFLLGIIAARVKSDLEIPSGSAKFISLYLLFSIGFKGGQELAHSNINMEIAYAMLFGLLIASIIPFYVFFIAKRKFTISDSGAIAASYGSVSAVTFVAASNFLESRQLHFDGHMVAVMALMESPAIMVGVIMMMLYDKESKKSANLKHIIKHSITNGSVMMILGSLIIGFVADAKQAEGIKPFTTDIFKGFLAIFLMEMGLQSGNKLNSFLKYGWSATLLAIGIPLLNGCTVAYLSRFVTSTTGDQFMFAVLAASASYIAVPAAMRLAAPKADEGLYLPMALVITFPLNITIGMPLYYSILQL